MGICLTLHLIHDIQCIGTYVNWHLETKTEFHCNLSRVHILDYRQVKNGPGPNLLQVFQGKRNPIIPMIWGEEFESLLSWFSGGLKIGLSQGMAATGAWSHPPAVTWTWGWKGGGFVGHKCRGGVSAGGLPGRSQASLGSCGQVTWGVHLQGKMVYIGLLIVTSVPY